jgi:hypothetical protein
MPSEELNLVGIDQEKSHVLVWVEEALESRAGKPNKNLGCLAKGGLFVQPSPDFLS